MAGDRNARASAIGKHCKGGTVAIVVNLMAMRWEVEKCRPWLKRGDILKVIFKRMLPPGRRTLLEGIGCDFYFKSFPNFRIKWL